MTSLVDAPPAEEDGLLPTKKSASDGGLGKYIVVRFFLIFPTILILVTMVFFLMRITGDPVTAALGGRLPPDQLAARIHQAGYDQPLLLQYVQYLGHIATGDFGRTISDNVKVTDMLATYGAATLELAINALIGALGKDYVEAGRSRGVSEYRLVTKHAYKPALIPIITVMGLQIATLLGGAVLTESTFGWKGLGFQLAEYLKARDFVAVQGIVMLLAVIVALSNFIVDVIAALIDPRVRY